MNPAINNPVLESQVSTEDASLARRRFVLQMRAAALRGDASAWAEGLELLVALESSVTPPAPSAAAWQESLILTAKSLLRMWLDVVRPKRVGGNAGDLFVDSDELLEYLEAPTRAEPAEVFDIGEPTECREWMCAWLSVLGTQGSASQVTSSFNLDPIETATLLLLYLIRIDPSFERACTFAQNDFTKKDADPTLIFGLIFGAPGPLWSLGRARLHPGGRLRRHHIITVSPSPSRPGREDLLQADEGILQTLDGQRILSPQLLGWARWIEPTTPLPPSAAGLETDVVDGMVRAISAEPESRIILTGAPDAGRTVYARALAKRLNKSLLLADGAALLEPHQRESRAAILFREAKLRSALLLIEMPPETQGPDTGEGPPSASPMIAQTQALGRTLSATDAAWIIAVEDRHAALIPALPPGCLTIEIPSLTTDQRIAIWQAELDAAHIRTCPVAMLRDLSSRYPLPLNQIEATVQETVRKLHTQSESLASVEPATLAATLAKIAGTNTRRSMSMLSERVTSTLRWADVVLDEPVLEQLMEVLSFSRYSTQVFDSWGFRQKLPYGRGLSALFYGPPGTGKTMIAAIIARDLGRELFRVDLSQVTSKWIGETEKNLSRIFDEARRHDAVLLFDEADALFSKRTEVKSSVDRFANMNVNFLLQTMESFEGVVLLTTNFEGSIDDAFKRRIRFKIEFPFPDEETRLQLWSRLIPSETPCAPDLNFDVLASEFEMSGGYIKDAVLRAAFMAAELGEPLSANHLYASARRVFKEMGRLVSAVEPLPRDRSSRK